MTRYRELEIGSDRRGKAIYRISLIDDKDRNILTVYIPKALERLDTIAYKFYNDPAKWHVIANANNIANGKLHPPAGKELIIPRL